MMKIKLIAVDLDGTLLRSDHQIGENTQQLLSQLSKTGIKIVPTSGRPLTGVLPYAEALDLTGENYAVLYNGALVQNLTGKKLVRHGLDQASAIALLKVQQLTQSNLHFMREDGFFTLDHRLSLQMAKSSFLTSLPLIIMPQVPADFSYLKAEFTGTPDEMDQLGAAFPAWLSNQYNVARSDPQIWELNTPLASKGNAVHELAARLGIEDDEVVVFGDQGNDLSMFQNPNFFKVAMGNATSALKERANLVTKTNDDEGIYDALERLMA